MFCVKCGAQLPPDSQFCTVCGTRVENAPIAAQPNVAPIAPMDQAFISGQPPKKKGKALLWVLIGVGVALIAAAVLFFVVFAPGGIAGPFSGNTVQTRFANDVVGVFSGAASGFETKSNMTDITEKPFDMKMNYTAEITDINADFDIEAAYDEKALGLSINTSMDYSNSALAELMSDQASADSAIKLLLLEDVLYVEHDGVTDGIRFDTKSDLSKPMSLKERISALMNNQNIKNINYIALIEAFLNSIDEKCFVKNADQFTLTLDSASMADALEAFSEMLDNDEALKESFMALSMDEELDFSEAIETAENSDYEMEWIVDFENGRPVGFNVSFDESGSKAFEAAFGYENEKNGKAISFELSDESDNVFSGNVVLSKTEKGVDFDGSIEAAGSGQIDISGSSEIDNENISGSVEISGLGMTASTQYEGTVSIGMPDKAVENDSRFELDTEGAIITDMGDVFTDENFSQMLPIYFWINMLLS